MRLCFYASLPGTVSALLGISRREVGIRLIASRPGAQEEKRLSHVSKRLVSATSAFPETRSVVSLRRLATHYQVCHGPPEGQRAPLHLISIRLNPLVQKRSILTVVQAALCGPRPHAERWSSISDRFRVIFRPTVYY